MFLVNKLEKVPKMLLYSVPLYATPQNMTKKIHNGNTPGSERAANELVVQERRLGTVNLSNSANQDAM
jgi:hypothetical protein